MFRDFQLERALRKAGFEENTRSYLKKLMFALVMTSIVFYFVFGNFGILISLLLGFLAYRYPFVVINQKDREREAQIPIFLIDMGTFLEMGIPFIDALELSSKREGLLFREIRKLIKAIRSGESIRISIESLMTKTNSRIYQRALSLLLFAYEHGSGAELRRMGFDLLEKQKACIKEAAGKLSLYTQVFMMVFVVAPTLILVASVLTGAEINIPFMLMIAFPSSAFVLAYASLMFFPKTVFFEAKPNYFILLSSVAIAIIIALPIREEVKLVFSVFVLLILALRFWSTYKKVSFEEKIEKALPDAALLLSTLPAGSHLVRAIEVLAYSDLEEIGNIFYSAYMQLRKGATLSLILKRICSVAPISLQTFVEVIKHGFYSGQDIGRRMAELAEIYLASEELRREQAAVTSVQRYSLLLGLLIMPIILSVALGFIKNVSTISKTSISVEELQAKYIPVYLVLSVGIAFFYLSAFDRKYATFLYAFFLPLMIAEYIGGLNVRFF